MYFTKTFPGKLKMIPKTVPFILKYVLVLIPKYNFLYLNFKLSNKQIK